MALTQTLVAKNYSIQTKRIMEFILDYIGIGIGLAGILLAIWTNKEKRKMEKMARIYLSGIAGEIKAIKENTNYTWKYFNEIMELSMKLPQSNEKNEIIKKSNYGSSNSLALDNSLNSLLNQAINTQEAMFNTKEIRYPEKD